MTTRAMASLEPGAAQGLELARGTLREAVSAIRNLDRLLSSPVVGPKSVLDVLPELRSSCRHLVTSTGTMLAAASTHLPDPAGVAALAEYVREQSDTLGAALDAVGRGPLKARARLELEALVRASVDVLNPARALVELLDEAVWGDATPVELADVVRQAFALRDRGSQPPNIIRGTLAPPSSRVELVVNPHVATRLVPVAVAVLAGPPMSPVRVQVLTEGAASCLHFSRQLGPGADLELHATVVIPPTLACARAALRAIGGALLIGPGAAEIRLVLPAKRG